MTTFWPLPIFLGVAVILVAAYLAGPRLVRGTLAARHAFRCPARSLDVGVEFSESAWDRHRVDVRECTAFSPPTDIRCDKACLALGALPQLAMAGAREGAGTWCSCWRPGGAHGNGAAHHA